MMMIVAPSRLNIRHGWSKNECSFKLQIRVRRSAHLHFLGSFTKAILGPRTSINLWRKRTETQEFKNTQ